MARILGTTWARFITWQTLREARARQKSTVIESHTVRGMPLMT